MKPSLIVLTVIIIACPACRNDRQDEARLKAINQSLVNSNKILSVQTGITYEELSSRQHDLHYEEKLICWMSGIRKVRELSENITIYIDSIKNGLKQQPDNTSFTNSSSTLLNKLNTYRTALIEAFNPDIFFKNNPSYQKMLQAEIAYIRNVLPITTGIDSIFKAPFPKEVSVLEAFIVLNKLQNDIIISENTILNSYTGLVRGTCGGLYTYQFSAIATISSSYLKSRQPLVIHAGVGSFNAAARPGVVIHGSKIPVDEAGMATYIMFAPDKPGEYSIPVTISYMTNDGQDATITKNLRYTVAE